MKRTITILFAAVLTVSFMFSGCGSDSEESEEALAVSGKLNEIVSEDTDTGVVFASDGGSELEKEIESKLSVQLMSVNEYTRPGDILDSVNDIVVHYVANPGTTAQENADYFTSLSESGETYASCHFIIGLDGEIIQLVPLGEISYCSNDRNDDTIAIECCHPDDTGVYTDATYESLVQLCAWLLQEYDLSYENVIRHYDVTGKLCPIAFVTDSDYWFGFKADVAVMLGLSVTADEIAANSDDTFETVDTENEEETTDRTHFENGREAKGGRSENGDPLDKQGVFKDEEETFGEDGPDIDMQTNLENEPR